MIMDTRTLKQILIGLSTYTPVNLAAVGGFSANRMKPNAAYCYEVWLKHLIMSVHRGGIRFPETVMEIGPGDSLGFGLAALISGVGGYVAVDAVRYTEPAIETSLFSELVSLFKNKTPLPLGEGIPDLAPYLDDAHFPESILTDDHLSRALSDRRLEEIENLHVETDRLSSGQPSFSYLAPYSSLGTFDADSFDLVFSHAVLEHIDDVRRVFESCASVLKPTGCSTHQIDLRCHNVAKEWNGHWKYGSRMWSLMRGRRPYLINRMPVSQYRDIIGETGLHLGYEETYSEPAGVARTALDGEWNRLTDEDLITAGTFIVVTPAESVSFEQEHFPRERVPRDVQTVEVKS